MGASRVVAAVLLALRIPVGARALELRPFAQALFMEVNAVNPGLIRTELTADVRSLAVGNYVLFHRQVEDGVVLLGQFH